jgi:hypothetical protein
MSLAYPSILQWQETNAFQSVLLQSGKPGQRRTARRHQARRTV